MPDNLVKNTSVHTKHWHVNAVKNLFWQSALINISIMKLIDIIKEEKIQILQNFVRFAIDELEINQIPRLVITGTHISNSESNSFAAYDRNEKKILLYIKKRHIMDVLRSLAHELVHFKQDLQGVLHADSGKTGSSHENEANAVAGKLMRKYGKLNPELFIK